MGAWGTGAFENDAALDWLGELDEENEMAMVADAISSIADAPKDVYLENDECCYALAAAEMIAAALGKPSKDFPDKEYSYKGLRPDAKAIKKAVQAVERIEKSSELQELWDEPTESKEWHASLSNLKTRLAE